MISARMNETANRFRMAHVLPRAKRTLSRVVEDYAEGVAVAAAKDRHAMAHGDPVVAAGAEPRPVAGGPDHRLALIEGDCGTAGLCSR